MSSCPPGAFCPAHPDAPGYLFLAAVAVLAVLLFATAAALLMWTIAEAGRLLARAASRAYARACVPRAQSQARARARADAPTRQYECPQPATQKERS
ncbi:hypothetical protein ACIQVK_25360 [Streptomyces sp. NPDC090493]|uniref:hypothetical protein n=1 Tax=Streptomyces sp. NPDC090493 TaxID=3365964 RepID=UPI00382B3F1E